MLRARNIRTPKLREQRRNAIINLIAVFLALIGAIILLLSQLSMLPAIMIQEIEVKGNDVLQDKILFDIAHDAIQGHHFNLFSKQNIFLYPKRNIEGRILSKHPRVKTVDVSFDTFSRITIDVRERKTYALYCTQSNAKCFVVDDEGVLFAQAPHFSSHSYFVYTTGLEVSLLRQTVLPAEEFVTFEAFKAALADIVPVQLAVLEVEDENEYRVVLENGAGIVFDPGDGYEQILQDLHSVLQSEEFQADVGENLENLSYIDLRFGNKVFFKLKSE